MKTKVSIMLGLLLAGLTGSSFAIEKSELDMRVHALTTKLEAMQRQPDKMIPADVLRNAQGIILLDRTKAGFLFAYQGGGGVAMVKDAATGNWSPVAFVGANEASLGLQGGGEQNFFVILLMNTNVTRLLTEPKFHFGGEARGTAGNTTAGVAGVTPALEQPVLVFDDRKGFYGGVAVKGGAVTPNDDANRAYYGQFLTMHEILFAGRAQHTERTTELVQKLGEYSKGGQYSSNAPK